MTLPPKLEKLLENWPVKIVSLIAAIFVYAFYQISSLETRSILVPLEVRESTGMICTDVSEQSIRLQVRGNVTDINTIEAKDFIAYADMGRYINEGSQVVPVKLDLSENVRIMKDIEIKIQPETVEVTLEKKLVSYIPVDLKYAGGTTHGYEIASIKTSPSMIKVSGPGSLVESLESIETDVILFDGLAQNTVVEANLREINEQLTQEHEGPVIVEVTVVPSKMKRVLTNLPIALYPAGDNFEIEMEKKTATLTISGNELDVEKYTPPANLIFADCSQITESGEYDIPVQYASSARFTIETLLPETVHVIVTEKPKEEIPESEE